MIKRWILGVVDAVFPIECVVCHREGVWVCTSCVSKLTSSPVLACPLCHVPTVGGVKCRHCAVGTELDSVVALGAYTEGTPLAALIGFFKYDYAESVRGVLPVILHSFFEQHAQTMASVQAIVPVPLHSSRYAERGFNQAEHIAAAVANYLHIPVIHALDRVRRTKQQARLSKQARINNVVQAFAVRPGVSLPEHLLLVDDVFTTGSTLAACAHELKKNTQVNTVHAWCLARG